MRKTLVHRCLALLLTLAVCLALVPGTWAAEEASTPSVTIDRSFTSPLERGTAITLKATTVPEDGTVEWESKNPDIARVNSQTGSVTAISAGEATIVAHFGEKTDEVTIVVSGIAAVEDPFIIHENETLPLDSVIKTYGGATKTNLEFSSRDTSVARVDGREITGLREGKSIIDATSNGGKYPTTFTVQVDPDPTTEIKADTITTTDTLPFSGLNFAGQLGGKVEYVTGLFVPTDRGTLYYEYSSESEPGRGVGQVDTYYRNPGPGQRALDGITFVPKPDYLGGNVTITYTAVTTDGRTYSCKITFSIKGISADSGSGIALKTSYGTAVQFDSIEFGSVCREKLGVQLDYVVFAQPPERQGTLYTNYSSADSYGSVVDIHGQYSRRSIDDVWFVPAPGYSGPVTVYYTGFGSNGKSYSGQVIITVEQEDKVAIGGLGYSVSLGGVARFDDEDFNDYCQELLDTSQTLSGIRFESLPGESDGVLYYEYQSSDNTGSRAAVGTVYYYGLRTPRIDRLTFVPAGDSAGTLKLPFTGWTTDGTSFSGNVEINIHGGATTGDIYYSCAPGKSVSFLSSDFTSLSRTMTGRTLDYIRFRDLPSASEGYLNIGSSRVSTGTSYDTSDIGKMSFRASSGFSGLVNITFEGRSTNGDAFTGVVTIGSSGTGSNTGSGGSTIRYTTDSKTAAVFDRDDFDDLSQWQTDRNVSFVYFDPPPSSQGTLYQNYRSSSNKGTRITSSTSIARGELNQVAFVPASGYTGTVYIDFTGTAANGEDIDGTVEIEVSQPAADVSVQYSTHASPVRFHAGDLAQSGASLSSVQFTSLPSPAAGYLYAQYASPILYGQQASTGISYRTGGGNLISDLAFVPRAGYTGTVTIPYTGTNSSGTTFMGEVVITVLPSYSSSYFSDMASYNNSQRAAVDFLYDHNITRGIGNSQYGPENSIRRGDFARMLYQAFEFSPTSSGAFVDVSPGAYYAEAVNALYARGIVSGVGNGYYAPDGALTRQDAVCMVQRAMRAVGWNASDGYATALSGYDDSGSVSGYAQGAMALAVQRGYLPTTGGLLNPQRPLTRVDMAEILHRVLTY